MRQPARTLPLLRAVCLASQSMAWPFRRQEPRWYPCFTWGSRKWAIQKDFFSLAIDREPRVGITRDGVNGVSLQRFFCDPTRSELILPLTQRGEYSSWIADAFAQILVRGFDDRGPRHAQKWVGRLFASYRRGQGRQVVAPCLSVAHLALEQRGIIRFDGLGEA